MPTLPSIRPMHGDASSAKQIGSAFGHHGVQSTKLESEFTVMNLKKLGFFKTILFNESPTTPTPASPLKFYRTSRLLHTDERFDPQRTSMLGRTQFGTTNFIDDLPRARPSGPFTLLPEWYRQSNGGAGDGAGAGGSWAGDAAARAAGDATTGGQGSPAARKPGGGSHGGAGSSGGGGAQAGASLGTPRSGPAALPATEMQGCAGGSSAPSSQRQSLRPVAVAGTAAMRPAAEAATVTPKVAASPRAGLVASGICVGDHAGGSLMQGSPASCSLGTPRRRPATLTAGANSARGRVESGPINKALLSVLDCY